MSLEVNLHFILWNCDLIFNCLSYIITLKRNAIFKLKVVFSLSRHKTGHLHHLSKAQVCNLL